MSIFMSKIMFILLSSFVFILLFFIAYLSFNEYLEIAVENYHRLRAEGKGKEKTKKTKKKVKTTDAHLFEISKDGTLISYSGAYLDIVIPEEINGIKVTKIGERFHFNHEGNLPKLKSVVFPDTLEEIGGYSFWGNELKRVVLPEGVRVIGDWSFRFNKITQIHLPRTVQVLGYDAFSYNKIKRVQIPDSIIKWDEKVFIGNPLKLLEVPFYMKEKVEASKEVLAKAVIDFNEETKVYTYSHFDESVVKYLK